MKLIKGNFVGGIYALSAYLIIMAGLIWLFNNASLDNKHILFYILLAITSVQSVLQEIKIGLIKKKLDEKI